MSEARRETPHRPSACNVGVYTGHDQSEQPLVIRHVTALSIVGGLLTIEADVDENDYTFSAHHRFVSGSWTRIEAAHFGSSGTDRG